MQDNRIPTLAVAGALLLATLTLSAFLIVQARGGGAELGLGATVCQTHKRDNAYWSWREIDGRRCWYRGARNKPKSELRWSAPASIVPPAEERSVAVERSGATSDPAPDQLPRKEVVQDGRGAGRTGSGGLDNEVPASSGARALSADELLAFTCCWPDLAELEAEAIGLRRPPREMPEPIFIPSPARPDNTWAWLWALLVPAGYMAWVAMRRAIQKRTPEG